MTDALRKGETSQSPRSSWQAPDHERCRADPSALDRLAEARSALHGDGGSVCGFTRSAAGLAAAAAHSGFGAGGAPIGRCRTRAAERGNLPQARPLVGGTIVGSSIVGVPVIRGGVVCRTPVI